MGHVPSFVRRQRGLFNLLFYQKKPSSRRTIDIERVVQCRADSATTLSANRHERVNDAEVWGLEFVQRTTTAMQCTRATALKRMPRVELAAKGTA
jgi:hypothetical protein